MRIEAIEFCPEHSKHNMYLLNKIINTVFYLNFYLIFYISYFVFFCLFVFCLFAISWAAPTAYESSQARG